MILGLICSSFLWAFLWALLPQKVETVGKGGDRVIVEQSWNGTWVFSKEPFRKDVCHFLMIESEKHGLCLSVSLWLYRCLCQTYWSGHLELQVKGLGCLVHNWSTAHLCCWGRKGHPLDVSVHGGAWLWHLWPLTPQDGHLAVSKNPEHYRWSTFHFIYFHFIYSEVCCSRWPDCSHKFR